MTCPVHGCKVYFGDVEGVSGIGVQGWVKLLPAGFVLPQELGEDFRARGNEVAGNTITDLHLPTTRACSRAPSAGLPPTFHLSKTALLLLALLQTRSIIGIIHHHLYPQRKRRGVRI